MDTFTILTKLSNLSLQGSILSLAIFMLVNSITPGPNNLMLLHGGIKRGFWACRWHMLGISVGVTIMLWLSYWGVATLVVNHPSIMLIIKILGTVYLLWLTYHLAKNDLITVIKTALEAEKINEQIGQETNQQNSQKNKQQKRHFGELPLTFWQAVLFQWLNPKAWTMTMVAPSLALFITDVVATNIHHSTNYGLNNWLLLILCMMINLLSISCWATGGHWLRKLVHLPKLMQKIHVLVVVMTAYCALSLWL